MADVRLAEKMSRELGPLCACGCCGHVNWNEYQQLMLKRPFGDYYKWGFREDLGHYVRSGWEANFARLLKFLGRVYEYEPRRFVIEIDGEVVATYLPDFYLVGLNRYVEVKGQWFSTAQEKVRLFREAYSDVELDIVDKAAYRHLASKFSKLVPNWE